MFDKEMKMILRDKNNMTQYIRHIISHIGTAANKLRRTLTLLFLMLTLGAGSVWGQAFDYSGTYYIASNHKTPDSNPAVYNYDANTLENNFYLCPTDWTNWCTYKPDNDFYEKNVNSDYPFVTTYKCRTNDYTPGLANAKWIITKHPNENYYYIQHAADGKYLMLNGQIRTTKNAGRMRVHLETVTGDLDDNALFAIIPDGTGVIFRPKTLPSYQLTVNAGNANSLIGESGKGDGPTGYTNTKGIIGIYDQAKDDNRYLYLEDYITRPAISYTYNSTTKKYEIVITAVQSGDITIKYTTNGTTPTSSNGTIYNGTPFDPEDGVTTIKAIVIVNNEESNVSTFTTPVLLGTNHKYLIQSQNNAWNTTDFHFYMIPGDVASNITKVNTTSLFRPTMEWHFLDAGKDTGVQYYYIVNANGMNLCYDTTNGVYMDTNSDNSNKFKFSIVESPTAGTFNINPYGLTSGNRYIFKANGNDKEVFIGLTSNNNNVNSIWKFVLSSSLDKTAPFTTSDPSTSSYSYYKIANVGNSDHYIIPGSPNAVTSNSSDVAMNWFFEEAQAATNNDWLIYYHIRNAVTGDYLYFNKDANNVGACLEMKSTIVNGNEDRYMFTWAKTADANVNYYIIPQKLKDVSQNQFSALRKHDNNTSILTNATRGAGKFAWTFQESTFTCTRPEITLSAGDHGYVITSTESDAKIYYKIGEGTLTPSTGTPYTEVISVAELGVESATIRAIAARNSDGSDQSTEASVTVSRVAAPSFTQTDDGKVELNCATDGVSYYYEMGTTPSDPNTASSTPYTAPIEGAVGKVIKAIAVKDGWINSTVATSETIEFACATPIIRKTSATTFTIECSFPTSGVTIRYTKGANPSDPTASSGEVYSGPVTFSTSELPFTVKAIAIATDYNNSQVAEKQLTESLDQDVDGYYEISSTGDFAKFIDMVNSDGASYSYKITNDITLSSPDEILESFTGELKGVAKADGSLPVISGLNHAIFRTINGGTVKNIILDNITISGSGNKGAIANEATGASRIYNCGVLATGSSVETDDEGYTHITTCSSEISGGGYVGGIVGLLDGSSRVINCFSYANITGGNEVGGIVGHNNVSTTSANLQTMVMNCMFYGDITGGTSKAPIYNGIDITNVGENVGLSNFNYFRIEASYVKERDINVYNCALAAETRFLQRFEFFRHLLNSNRSLAAWWATGDASKTDEIKKWVLEPSQIGSTTPYPILKDADKYASIVNYTPNSTAIDANGEHRNEGRKLTEIGDNGVLHVTIRMGDGAVFSHPNSASITTSSVDLTITDKDPAHFNFNYGKVQLPYYNDYGTLNYTNGLVVTGWKIVSITGGTPGNYTTGDDVTYTDGELTATPYNFADRKCTNKDLYGTGGSNRIFNQGAYWDVPEGVTAITIEPYWAKAVYLADDYLDVVYNQDMTTAYKVTTVGGGRRYENAVSKFNGQTVYTTMSNAVTALNPNTSNTVYDYAVVLIGNYHQYNGIEANKPYTVTSVDLDKDNEPDYSFMLRFNGRTPFHPVRYDFLNLIGLGMAQKSDGGTGSYNLGIMQPKALFEVTNTALFRVTQFEYSAEARTKNPYIMQGGVIEQWVTQQHDAGDKVSYFIVGGNVWFKEFHRGSHQDNADMSTPHPPVSVTGGDYEKFYLTGLYQSQAAIYDDNAECYINGGRFGEMAGAGMEGIGSSDGKGNITWIIDNADIKEFYGGGINYAKPVHGNIHTIISNSHVTIFCGGPKFGDMESGCTVITKATDCTFGKYFGAGYGGNSFNRYAPTNQNNVQNINWNNWVSSQYKRDYNETYFGVSTQIDYQFIPVSSNDNNVCRLFVEFVGFSLATTHNVNSSLTGCTVTDNFYGGGSLGKVDGSITSTLTNCTVKGNVFGAGYSASLPDVEVDSIGFRTEPYYYQELGSYRTGVKGRTTTYRWEHGNAISVDNNEHILYTTENLNELGSVNGSVSLTLTTNGENGKTTIGTIGNDDTGHVYGGGDESTVYNTVTPANASTIVTLSGNTEILGSVFGGGNQGDVSGSTQVIIE